jgi:hypothetical protein
MGLETLIVAHLPPSCDRRRIRGTWISTRNCRRGRIHGSSNDRLPLQACPRRTPCRRPSLRLHRWHRSPCRGHWALPSGAGPADCSPRPPLEGRGLRRAVCGPVGARPALRPAEGPWYGRRDGRRGNGQVISWKPPQGAAGERGTRRAAEAAALAGLARTRRGEGCVRCSQLPSAPRATKLHPSSKHTHTHAAHPRAPGYHLRHPRTL